MTFVFKVRHSYVTSHILDINVSNYKIESAGKEVNSFRSFGIDPKYDNNMSIRCLDILNTVFKCVCWIAAFFMVGFWILKFHKNDDVSSIEYILYDDPKSIVYPELTLCIYMPFTYQIVLSNSNGTVSADQYNQYLQGAVNVRDEYRRIRFNNVTLDILEYVQNIIIYFRNQPITKNLSCTSVENCPYVKFKNNFNGLIKGSTMRCFGVEVDSSKRASVESLAVTFKPSLNNEIRKVRKNNLGQVYLGLNYPGQVLRNTGPWKPIWNAPNSSHAVLSTTVSAMEVLRRRNKNNDPCLENWKLFDEMVLTEHHDTVGCSPPYQESDKPLCNTRKQIEASRYELVEMRNKYQKTVKKPCEELASIVFTADQVHYSDGVYSDYLKFYFRFPEKIKVIHQMKSVDLHALIGNIGGYIGLFIGNMSNSSLLSITYLYFYSFICSHKHM